MRIEIRDKTSRVVTTIAVAPGCSAVLVDDQPEPLPHLPMQTRPDVAEKGWFGNRVVSPDGKYVSWS
jgi:hypothetical protein